MVYRGNNLKSYLKSVANSFKYAFDGVIHTLKHERNFRIETGIALLALVLGGLFKITKIEWLVIILCIGGVLSLELINTSIEAVVDLVTQHQIYPLAKIAKDVGAAAVFLASMISLIIGIIIFLPYFISFISYWGLI